VSLTAADVAEIMRLVESSSFQELNLEFNGMKLSLRRGGGPVDSESLQRSATALTTQPAVVATGEHERLAATDPSLHEVKAPLLGTFYRAPKPGAAPFLEKGAVVEPETVIGIIEVMKLMNTVRAGVHGTVAEILADDGTLVEFGQTILRIVKSG